MAQPSSEPESMPEAPPAAKKPRGKIVAVIVVLIVIIAAIAVFTLSQAPVNRAPVISQVAVSSESAETGQTLTFTAEASDPDGDSLTYAWDFGDGTSGTGATSTHAYSLQGRFIALLTVTDGKGGATTNDGSLQFVQVKLPGASVQEPSACASGATDNWGFDSDNASWTYADWEDSGTLASGNWNATNGDLDGHLNVSTDFMANTAVSGYFYQAVTVTGSPPYAAMLHVGWSVLAFGATGGNATFYAFVDPNASAPISGQQVWNSTPQILVTGWTNVTADVSSTVDAPGTYYVKIALRTENAAVGVPTIGGFDNVALTWSNTVCAAPPVIAILSSDQTATQTGTQVMFNGNASWAYAFAWNDASDHSLGGVYTVTAAQEDATLFSSFLYSWSDGTQNTMGNSTVVGKTPHTFSAVGNFFVKLTVNYTITDLNPRTTTSSAGYTVRVLAAAPPVAVKYPDVFTTVTFGEPQYLDPAVDYETSGGEILQNVYETLIWYEQGNESVTKLVPRLATDVPTAANGGISTDGLLYNFTLRSNVNFHSGGTMTADDVVYSLSRVLAIHDPDGPSWIVSQALTDYAETYAGASTCPTPSGSNPCTVGDWIGDTYAWNWGAVPPNIWAALTAQGVTQANANATVFTPALGNAVIASTVLKVDSTHVQIVLTHPFPAFLQAIAFTVGSVVSKACVEAHGGVVWGEHNAFLDRQGDCGTGPFKLRVWEPNQVIILDRFDTYWRTPAKIREVHIAKANDIATREFMLRSGDADVAIINRDHQYDVMNPDGTPKYPTLYIVKDKPTFDVLFFGYNQNINTAATPDPWTESATFFGDIHVRKAFSYSFDYNQFISQVIFNGGTQLRGPIPQGMLGYNGSTPLFTYDLDKAATELQATGYWNSGFNITLYYNAGNTIREKGSLLLKQGLEALHTQKSSPGVFNVKVQALDWPVYLNTLQSKGLPIFFLGWAPDYADPNDYADPFLLTGATFPNRIGYSNTTLDALLNAAGRELNPMVRDQMYQDIMSAAVINDVPYLWIYQATNFHVEREWVSGYYFNPMLSGQDYYVLSKG